MEDGVPFLIRMRMEVGGEEGTWWVKGRRDEDTL